jgi:phosphoribosyl-AMP cyclohydrolase/phosphoribosyl-ATP pyrophosphohydrolase/phosphoribosyl-AMP cyclohydrolase
MDRLDVQALHFDDKGLIPCVVQQEGTGEVLMVAWMNAESLRLTLETGTTWFWSRSRLNSGTKGYKWQQAVAETLLVDCEAVHLARIGYSEALPATQAIAAAFSERSHSSCLLSLCALPRLYCSCTYLLTVQHPADISNILARLRALPLQGRHRSVQPFDEAAPEACTPAIERG